MSSKGLHHPQPPFGDEIRLSSGQIDHLWWVGDPEVQVKEFFRSEEPTDAVVG